MMENHIKMKTPKHEPSVDHSMGEGAVESEESPAQEYLDAKEKVSKKSKKK